MLEGYFDNVYSVKDFGLDVDVEENGENLISDDEHTKTSDECDNSIEIVAQELKANEEEI